MPVVPALGGQKQEVHELLTSLGYTVRLYLMKQESVFNCVCISPVKRSLDWQQESMLVWCRSLASLSNSSILKFRTWLEAVM